MKFLRYLKSRPALAVLAAAAVTAVILILIAVFSSGGVSVSRYTFKSDGLPLEFDGYKVLQISDLDGAVLGESNEKLIEKAKALRPDIIVFTGNMAPIGSGAHSGVFAELAKALSEVAPIYAVSGHADRMAADFEETKKYLEDELGAVYLENASAVIEKDGAEIRLHGLLTPYSKNRDTVDEYLEAASKRLQIEEGFNILLFHRADLLSSAVKTGCDLVLSGWLHGGFIRLPLIGGVISPDGGLFPEREGGRYQIDGTTCIVSRGIGEYSLVPRVFNRPELVLVTLAAGDGSVSGKRGPTDELDRYYTYAKYKDRVIYEYFAGPSGLESVSYTYGELFISERAKPATDDEAAILRANGYTGDAPSRGDYLDLLHASVLSPAQREALLKLGFQESRLSSMCQLDYINYIDLEADKAGTLFSGYEYTDEQKSAILERMLTRDELVVLRELGYSIEEISLFPRELIDALVFKTLDFTVTLSAHELIDELESLFEELAEFSSVEKLNYGESHGGRPLTAYRITGPRADGDKKKILLVFGLRGYEDSEEPFDGAYYAENALTIIKYYAENPLRLQNTELIVIPCANPDALYHSSGGRRTTLTGVDMNRDFIPSGFKAAESRALRDFITELDPDILINFMGFLGAMNGDAELSEPFAEYMKIPLKGELYGASNGYLIGYAKNQGIRSLLVQYSALNGASTKEMIIALNVLMGNR